MRANSIWIGAGAWAGIVLAAARCTVVFVMDRVVRGHDLELTRWRVSQSVPWVLAWSLAAGLACAWLLERTSTSKRARFAATCVCAASMLAVLAGWPFDDAYHRPGTGSSRGLASLAALCVASLVCALVLRSAVKVPRFGRGFALASAIFLAVLMPVGARMWDLRTGSTMTVRNVVRDLTVDLSAFAVEAADPTTPPLTGTITPDFDFHRDVGEMPALLMPPPCRASVIVPSGFGPLRLTGAAGCDFATTQRFTDRASAPRFGFRVEVDGRTVFEHHREPWKDEAPSARAWARFDGGEGIEVAPGSRVTLSVDVERPIGARDAEKTAIGGGVGFGGLAFVRAVEVARARATTREPNIVLVVVDTLRADRTTIGGYARPTTPALERLAARGIVYENACSAASWTWPSTASILTGLDPSEHGVVSDSSCYLPEEITTLAEALQKNGWTTAAFSGNPLVAPSHNFGQGFETFGLSPGEFLTSEKIVPDALAWLGTRVSVRFFLYLHLIDPHEIHRIHDPERAQFAGDPPPGMDEHAMTQYADRLLAGESPEKVVPPAHLAWLKAGYDAGVATSDHWIGRLLDRLDELGLRETTMVAITSDHGEEFLEHGHLKHGQSLYTELVHVPLVIAGPGIAHGARVKTIVSNLDLAASLARAGGVQFGSAQASDLLHPETLVPLPVFTSTEYGWWRGTLDSSLRGTRADGWSLHYDLIAGRPDAARALDEARVELFDLRTDPMEQHDVAREERNRALALVSEIERREAALTARRPRSVPAGSGTQHLLEATGYAGQGH
jgi:arylsulfatase A-like enzyme